MKTTISIPACFLALFLSMAALAIAAPAEKSPAKAANEARLAWWRAARFGMFIHWGPVSLKGTEIGWSRGAQVPIEEYDHLYQQFNPVKFNADQWVKIAKDAGMKYIVFTTKHHDGFCMFDTKQTDFNIMHSPFGRDVVKELSAACRKQGIAFGTYYSVCDWHHPDFPFGSPGGSTQKAASQPRSLRAVPSQAGCGADPQLRAALDALVRRVPRASTPSAARASSISSARSSPTSWSTTAAPIPGDFDTPEQHSGHVLATTGRGKRA